MDNFFQGWSRALIILVLLLPILFIRKEFPVIKKEDWKWFVVFLVFTSMTQAPLFYAFNHMHIGSAYLLFFVAMFFTINAVGFGFLGEQLTWIKVISSIFALVGTYFVFSFSLASFEWLGAVMALVGGVASGGEIAFSKKITDKYSSLYVVTLSWAIIFITNLLISLLIGEEQASLGLSMNWFWQFCYSIASLAGFWLVIAGFKYMDASIAALLCFLEIVFTMVFAFWIFHETVTPSIILGGALIIIGASLSHIIDIIKKSQVKVGSS